MQELVRNDYIRKIFGSSTRLTVVHDIVRELSHCLHCDESMAEAIPHSMGNTETGFTFADCHVPMLVWYDCVHCDNYSTLSDLCKQILESKIG